MSKSTTATLPNTDETVAAYRAADRSGKAAIRADVKSSMLAAIHNGDLALAQHYVAVQSQLTSPVERQTKVVDWIQVIGNQLADLRAAIAAIESGNVNLPEGVDCPTYNEINTAAMSTETDPESVAKLVTFKGRKSDRGVIGDYLDAVVGNFESGTFAKVSELRNHLGADYLTEAPSAGAVSAFLNRHLERGTEFDGFEIGHDESGKLGVTVL